MWPISELMTVNILTNLIGMFFQADYSSDIVIQMNIKVIEKIASAQSFEFSAAAIEAASAIEQNKFPDKFLFGAASSAYQIEGAYNSPGTVFMMYYNNVIMNSGDTMVLVKFTTQAIKNMCFLHRERLVCLGFLDSQ